MNVKDKENNYFVKKPLEIRLREQKDGLNSGVLVVDVQIVQPFNLGSISFKNNYVGYITIKVKCKPKDDRDEARWRMCVSHFPLMPDPHNETASQDYFTISRSAMLFDPMEVTGVRLVLLQPSPVWTHFGIENVAIFQTEIQSESSVSVTAWLLENQHLTTEARKHFENIHPVDKITAGLQHLWALTEAMRSNQTKTTLGRYDVDGSYEINLLSYT